PPPHSSSLFPYTTLFRSIDDVLNHDVVDLAIELGRARSAQNNVSAAIGQFATIRADERGAGIERVGAAEGGQCAGIVDGIKAHRSEEHTSELQSLAYLVC